MKKQTEQESVMTKVSSPKNNSDVYPTDYLDKYAEITRYLIAEENARLNERTTWLLQLNGLLFAALAFAWSSKDLFILWILSLVGIFTSLAIGNSLRWAVRALDKLGDEWSVKGKDYRGPPITGLTRKEGLPFERIILMHPPYILPIIFAIAWAAVILFHLI